MRTGQTIAAFITVLLASTAICTAQGVATTEDNWKLCREDDPDPSIRGCTALIEAGRETPTDLAIAYYDRGLAYAAKDDDDRAIDDYDKAIHIDPTDPDFFYARGNAHERQDDYDEAITDYTHAIALDPTHADAFAARGIAYSDKDQPARAIADYTRALELDPTLSVTHYNRALEYQTLKRDDAALADLTIYVDRAPDDPDGFERRGEVYYRQQQYALALNDFTRAVELDPKDVAALYGRGASKRERGDTTGSDADIRAAKELRSDIVDVMRRRGVSLAAGPVTSELDAAWERCRAGTDLDRRLTGCTAVIASNGDEHRAEAFHHRAWVRNEQGDYRRAVADADAAIELDDTSAETFSERGYALWKLQRYADAVRDYSQSLLLRPDHVQTLVERALANFSANQYGPSRLDFEIVVRLDSANARGLFGRGWLKKLSGEDGGDADIAAAIRQQPDIARIMAADGFPP